MPSRSAATRYLGRHAQPEAQSAWPFGASCFDCAVVIPAYDESRTFIDEALTRAEPTSWVLIVVVNAQCHADSAAVARTMALLTMTPAMTMLALPCKIGRAFRSADERRALWLIDAVSAERRFGEQDGVGLARKIGMDMALAHIEAGRIRQTLIRCTDADATWPANYFEHQADDAVSALTFGFRHSGPGSQSPAQTVYDCRLRDYPGELARAGSPYGFQALGSAMAINAPHYAQVGGCPKRLAGEDFHLLAKLAKIGRVEHCADTVVELRARHSHRVPFGTGPGVRELSSHDDPMGVPFFVAPRCFGLLRIVLDSLRRAVRATSASEAADCLDALGNNDDVPGPRAQREAVLKLSDLRQAVTRARAASADATRRIDHVMIWFDALKTRQFLHRLRDAGWADVSYRDLKINQPERFARAN